MSAEAGSELKSLLCSVNIFEACVSECIMAGKLHSKCSFIPEVLV